MKRGIAKKKIEKELKKSNWNKDFLIDVLKATNNCNRVMIPTNEEFIIECAAEAWNTTPEVMLTDSKVRHVSTARCFVFKQLRASGYTYQHIGDIFKRNHSTIVHGVKKIQDWIEFDKLTRSKWNEFINLVEKKTI